MELKEFVTQTLVQIVEGVKDAQEQLKDSGALINPLTHFETGLISNNIEYRHTNATRNVQSVKMDIAVSVSENEGNKKGIGIVATAFKAGASSESSDSSTKTSRVEFDIPISFPVSNYD